MTEEKQAPPSTGKAGLLDNEFTAELPQDAPINPQAAADGGGKYRREIDLGDGSGKQVFEADTAEGLIDKLTEAQKNATQKIREQAGRLRRARPEIEAPDMGFELKDPRVLSADELLQIGTELQTNPDAAFDKILQAKTGMTSNELRTLGQQVSALLESNALQAAEVSFLQNHQGVDYLPSVNNARAIQEFLQEEDLPYTAANLEYAFQELSEGGLLEMPSSKQETDKDGNRIDVRQHSRRKPLSTGIRSTDGSSRSDAEREPEAKGALTETEVTQLYKMPLEDARAFMMQKMRQAAGARR